MGKQTRRTSKHRTNPLARRIQSNKAESTALSPSQVLPAVEKLSSADPTERGWAASSISNLVLTSPENLKMLLSKGVVGSLIKLLTDDTREVAEEALGTLRNLASIDPDVCQEYFSKEILTPLSALLPQISQTIDLVLTNAPLADTADQDKRTTIWDVAENFIYIIWGLSESSEECLTAINRLNVVPFLISFLSAADRCPNRVVIAAGQCLTTLTDDNKDIYLQFHNHPEYVQMLLGILTKFNTEDKMLIRVLACATLINIRDVVQFSSSWEDTKDTIEELNKMIMPILISTLNFDIQNAAQETQAAMASGNVTNHNETPDTEAKPKQPLTKEDIYLQNVEEHLATLQLSLELLADICLQDETGADGWEDADENMEEDTDEDKAAEEMTNNLNEDNVEDYLRDAETLDENNTSAAVDEAAIRSSTVLSQFTTNVFPRLINLAAPTCLSFPTELIAPNVTQALTLTHKRSLECLNNFLLAMNDIPSKFWFREYNLEATKTWGWLFANATIIGSSPESEDRSVILETIVGCLWALGRGLGQNIPLEPGQVSALCEAYRNSDVESMRVKIIGCLSQIAARQGEIKTNKDIGVFIMEVLNSIGTNKTQADAAAEALNFMFDVYSDCAFDYDAPVFVQEGFNKKLKKIVPSVKAMVKSVDRRKNFDLRNRLDEALMNLVAFTKYKASEKRN